MSGAAVQPAAGGEAPEPAAGSSSSAALPDHVAKSVTRGDLAALTSWLNASNAHHVDSRDAKGRTLLMLAVAVGQRALVQELIRRGASLDVKQRQGTTALMFACYAGDIGLVKALLVAKAKLDPADNRGLSALHYARLKDHTAVYLLLQQHYRSASAPASVSSASSGSCASAASTTAASPSMPGGRPDSPSERMLAPPSYEGRGCGGDGGVSLTSLTSDYDSVSSSNNSSIAAPSPIAPASAPAPASASASASAPALAAGSRSRSARARTVAAPRAPLGGLAATSWRAHRRGDPPARSRR